MSMKKDKESNQDSTTKRTRKSRKARRKEQEELVRIEELEKLMAENGGEVDEDTLVSMYMPHRRAKRVGAALLRMDKLHIILLVLFLLIAGLFILAFMQEKMGNFTINLNRLELYRRGIAIDTDGNFSNPTARLTANSIQDATNITLEDLPEDIDEVDGGHNGRNYMAYTYYVRNAGKEDVGYSAVITLDSYSKGAENAVRVAVWRNGERMIYAEPAADGSDEDGCTSFESHDVVCTYTVDDFLVGNVDKYTVVIWMEGEDPECVDAIVGGSVEFSMNIDALEESDSSLFAKFAEDIWDTITGGNSINAAGTDAPDYYNSGDVTWSNRRNKDN